MPDARVIALALALASPLFASQPGNTPVPSPSPSISSSLPPPASGLTAARLQRAAVAWPRLIGWLESRKPEVQAAEARAARRSVVASRCRALSALEAWLALPPQAEARAQLATYLTVPPEQLIADVTAAANALDELAIQEQAASVRQQTEAERAQLEQLATDPRLPASERAQLKEELAALARTEEELATAGEPLDAAALELARTHKPQIERWLAWRWK